MNSCHVAAAEGGRSAVRDYLADSLPSGASACTADRSIREELADPTVGWALAEQAQRREHGADVLERVAILGEDQHAITPT
jgi:hypothetical protein